MINYLLLIIMLYVYRLIDKLFITNYYVVCIYRLIDKLFITNYYVVCIYGLINKLFITKESFIHTLYQKLTRSP